MTDLKIARGQTLPVEMVTETIAFLARRGGGKSNAAVVLAEEMHDAGFQWVAIDPKGDWWGVRSDAKGTGPGLPVPVFGGRHGDLPLEPAAGSLMARLVVERDLTCVLDVALFSKAEQIRFVTDFAETLFRAVGDVPRPMHLFLEEAEEMLPQRVDARSARMVGAYSKIAKQGRTAGLGVSLITQRSASLNKDALSQTSSLILFQTTSPHDRKAVVAWADYHVEAGNIAESLSSLRPGESWILSPGFLGSIEKVQWRRRRTFDSGATPTTAKATKRKQVTLADIDLGEIKDLMAETIEHAEANDPKILRREIARLERELAARPSETIEREVERLVEVPVVPPAAVTLLESIESALRDMTANVENLGSGLEPVLVMLHQHIDHAADGQLAVAAASSPPVPAPASKRPTRPPVLRATPAAVAGDVQIGGGALRILEALARFPAGMTRAQVATHARMKKTGGSFGTYVSRLATAGLVERVGKDLRITEAGLAYVGAENIEALTGETLREEWRSRLGGGALRMFDALVARYPHGVTKDELANVVEMEKAGGSFGTYLSRLRSNGLLDEAGGVIAASEELFR